MEKKVIEEVVYSIEGARLIQKVLNDFNNKKKKYQGIDSIDKLSSSVSIFINGVLLLTRYFGKNKVESIEKTKNSIDKGLRLISYPEYYRSGNIELNYDGALRFDGVIVSVDGFNHPSKNEYLSWIILNMVKIRMIEINKPTTDLRWYTIDNNLYIIREKKRLELLLP